MKWTLDKLRENLPLVAIYLTEIGDTRHVRTVDLQGAHVLLDVDDDGNVVGVEILGPAVRTDLTRLDEYLKEPPTVLGDDNAEHKGEEDGAAGEDAG
jgi:uncharacterized protein YuzE